MPVKVEPEYFKKHIMWLTGMGINVIPVDNVWYKWIYKLYSVIILTYVFLYFVLEVIDTVKSVNFTSMMFGLCHTVTHILALVKMILLIVKKKNVRNMLLKLESKYFKPNMERGGEEEFRLINSAIKRANIHAEVFKYIALSIIGSRGLFAIFDKGTYVEVLNEEYNITEYRHMRTLPYKAWFPTDLNKSPAYELMFVYQISCLTLYGLYIGFVDAVIYGLMFHMTMQYIILNKVLQNCVHIARNIAEKKQSGECVLDRNIKYVGQPGNMENVPLESNHLQDVLQDVVNYCARYHLDIIHFCDDIENEFCYLVLSQFLSSLYILCFLLFQLSVMPSYLSFEFISMCLYLFLMMYQLFCFCWYGNELMLRSWQFSLDIYESEWLVANNKIKKSLLLMMMRCQRPAKFTAGKFAIISLETYVTVVRASASYFMVLKQMNQA
ncbi:hypothetical protein NQ317_016823 [Molorchus minor]|uniref:Odorant receptor n=1 Tax=Molorchus minor TaxID=1323400 RepID=A0ABQ9JLV1_9CUCU|nr:hypothetical protein NQ317_016823 [Molorchus minor]